MAYFSLAEYCFKSAEYYSEMPLPVLEFKSFIVLYQKSILQTDLTRLIVFI
jgi:hypothetical protein